MSFEYKGKSRIIRGGAHVAPSDLSSLSESEIKFGLKWGIIREIKTKKNGKNKKAGKAGNANGGGGSKKRGKGNGEGDQIHNEGGTLQQD